jgi:uncharacterized protein (DUF1330 family)
MMLFMPMYYLDPTDEAAIHLFTKPLKNDVYMLNLLRFKTQADYSQHPQLAPTPPISGREAYMRYVEATLPMLQQSGGDITLIGQCDRFFIGPADECWDLAMIIKQHSLNDFLAFASNPDYLKIIGHRVAALEDSRLLPIEAIGPSGTTVT